MQQKYASYTHFVEEKKKQKLLGRLTPMTPINGAFLLLNDEKILSFCSHDYLALSENPDIKKSAIKSLLQDGICPSFESQDLYSNCQQQLEKKFSTLLRRETALFFSSRFEANQITLSSLGKEDTMIFLDEQSHLSLHKGAQNSQAKVCLFPHNDVKILAQLLKKDSHSNKIIVTESILSSLGSISNIPSLIELAEQYEALLFVDDSHSFGVTGVEGMGLCAHFREIDLISGCFSKACGACGGYIVCSKVLRDYLLSDNPEQTHHLLPPPIIGAIERALDIIPQFEGERKQLQQRSHWLRNALRKLDFPLDKSNTPLLSLSFQNLEEASDLSSYLKDNQILVSMDFSAKIHIALNVCHMPDHLTQLVDGIKEWQNISKQSLPVKSF